MSEKNFAEGIIENLRSGSQLIKEHAAYELSFVDSEEAVKALTDGLSDENHKIRALCAKSLERHGKKYGETFVPVLIGLLSGPDAAAALAAARAIGCCAGGNDVPELVKLLESENAAARLYSCIALGGIADESSLKPLLKLLRDEEDERVKASVVTALGKFKNSKILPFILKFGLSDDDPRVRAASIETVSALEIPSETAVDIIKKYAGDPENRMAANACSALWRYDRACALDHINTMIKSGQAPRRAAGAYALGATGDAAAIEPLSLLKNDQDAHVRMNAACAVSHIKSEKAVDFLLEMLEDQDETVKAAAFKATLGLSDKSAFWPMVKLLKSSRDVLRMTAARVLCNIDDPAALPLIGEAVATEVDAGVADSMKKFMDLMILRHPEAIKSRAHGKKEAQGSPIEPVVKAVEAASSGSSPDIDDVSSEKTIVDKIINKLFHKSQFLREEAAYELSYVKSEKAVRALIKGLSDVVPKVRAICLKSLASFGAEYKSIVTPKVIELLYDDNNEVAQNSAHTLGVLRDKTSVPALIEILNHENASTRLYAAMALGRMNDPSVLKPLLELLQRDHDKKIRATVLTSLGYIADPKTLPIILKYGLSDNDPHVRASAAEAISKLGLPFEQAAGHLKKLLKDVNNRVVANACLGLWRIGDFTALDNATRLIKNTEKWFRASGAYVLGQIGTVEAVNMLLSLKNDHDVDVRLNVARALGNIKSTKALTALVEMLDDEDDVTKNTAYDAILRYNDKFAFWPMVQNLKSPHESIRYIAARVLCNIGDPAGVAPMLEAASHEKNAEVKSEISKYTAILAGHNPSESFKDIFAPSNKNTAMQEEALNCIDALHVPGDVKRAIYETASKSETARVAKKAGELLNNL